MDEDKRVSYDKTYIESLYTRYMSRNEAQQTHFNELQKRIEGRNVLLIAPGASSSNEKEKIIRFAQKTDTVSISINFDYSAYCTDYIFVSNLRRFRELSPDKHGKCIVTSNIPAVDVYLRTRYADLLNDEEPVRDNAGMMLIRFMINLGAKKLYLAGMDGYSVDPMQNYADQRMAFYTQRAIMESMNDGMNAMLRRFSEQIEIEMLTTPRFLNV